MKIQKHFSGGLVSLCAVFLVLGLGACSSAEISPKKNTAEVADRRVASGRLGPDGLPMSEDVQEFFETLDRLDLNNPAVEFNDGTGGMSINLEYKFNGARGDFLSRNADGAGDNSAGHPEGQVLAYNLSRVFGVSNSYGRARWTKISGRPVQVLHSLAEKVNSSNKHVQEGKSRVLATTSRPEVEGSISVYGAFKPINLSGLEMDGGPNGVFNTSSPLANLIQAGGRQPRNSVLGLGKNGSVPVNEAAAAKMLSTSFLIDALTEQFDRFSGGNIQVVKDGDLHRLVSYDNGGAGVPGWGTGYVKRYLGWTTRFERRVAESILEMNRFVTGKSSRFLDFTNVDEFLKALGLRSYKSSFKKHLAEVAAHIEATVQRNGSNAYFQ